MSIVYVHPVRTRTFIVLTSVVGLWLGRTTTRGGQDMGLGSIRTIVTTGRKSSFSLAMAAIIVFSAVFAIFGTHGTPAAATGQWGTINTQGAALMVHPTDHSTILAMEAGTPVDILFGPYEGMYEVRYYGTDGWVWAEYLNVDGVGAVTGSVGGSSGATQGAAEHWIDVNRSNGTVSLMIGNSPQATFNASMGYDTSADGFYSTAVGTYYIYEFDGSLHYTDLADVYIDHWIGFDTYRFNGFHSYSKDANGTILPNGGGRTGGCVALAPGDIDAVWEFASMGMRVEVHF